MSKENKRQAEKDNPLVSVIMVTYGHEDTIERAIRSILAQDYEPIELIISEDCSPDNSRQVIEQTIADYDGPVRIVTHFMDENIGGVANVNEAMAMANGDYMAFCDGDDAALPNRISAQMDVITKKRCSLVACNAYLMDGDGEVRTDMRYPNGTRFAPHFEISKIYKDNYPIFGASFLFDRALYDQYGPIDIQYSMNHNADHALFLRAQLQHGHAYLPEPLLHYRVSLHGTTISRRRDHARSEGRELEAFILTQKINLNLMGNVMAMLQSQLESDKPDVDSLRETSQRIKGLFSEMSALCTKGEKFLEYEEHYSYLRKLIADWENVCCLDTGALVKKGSNQFFVYTLYRTLLGREPDTGGYLQWLNALESGFSREELIDQFAASDEARQKNRKFLRPRAKSQAA